MAQSAGADFRALKDLACRGATGVPAEFMVLEYDLGEVKGKLGVQELNLRSKLLDAYRVLAFPKGGGQDAEDLFSGPAVTSLLECFRVDFGERPDDSHRGKKGMRRAVAEQPILQCPREVLWRALQDGARENRWVLYLRGPNLAIGAGEMGEWPGTPRFDESAELWTYQAALDEHIYPREIIDPPVGKPLSAATLYDSCWPAGQERLGSEDLERAARAIWTDLSRPRLEVVLLEGLQAGHWALWKQGPEEGFFTAGDPLSAVRVGADWMLVAPGSQTARDLDGLRPGRGPQPLSHSGTPREVFVTIWEELGGYPEVVLAEMTLVVTDRDTLDNSLLATWTDRPASAQTHATLRAAGRREVDGKTETLHLSFEGRFEELPDMLATVWPFGRQGDLDVTIAVQLSFDPPIAMGDATLESYRTALMSANQGTLEARVIPARNRTGRSA